MEDRLYFSEMCINAFRIAIDHHQYQKDKSNMSCFWHPLRVANECKGWRYQIVGILHDVLEDCYYNIKDLRDLGYLPQDIIFKIGTRYRYFSLKDIETLGDSTTITIIKNNLLCDIPFDEIKNKKITIDDLYSWGITDKIILDAIVAITKIDNETYDDFINRVKENQIARIVKLRDIDDNLSIERLSYLPTEIVVKLTKKYHKAVKTLRDIESDCE